MDFLDNVTLSDSEKEISDLISKSNQVHCSFTSEIGTNAPFLPTICDLSSGLPEGNLCIQNQQKEKMVQTVVSR